MKILSLLTILALAMPVMARAGDTFPFESYQDAASFNTALQAEFPAGSSFKAMSEKILKSGARQTSDPATPNTVFIYSVKSGKLYNSVETKWIISVSHKNDVIRSVSTNYGLTGL